MNITAKDIVERIDKKLDRPGRYETRPLGLHTNTRRDYRRRGRWMTIGPVDRWTCIGWWDILVKDEDHARAIRAELREACRMCMVEYTSAEENTFVGVYDPTETIYFD